MPSSKQLTFGTVSSCGFRPTRWWWFEPPGNTTGVFNALTRKKDQQRNNNKKRRILKSKETVSFIIENACFFEVEFFGGKWVKGKPPNKGELIHLKIELKKSFVYWRLCTTCISENKNTVKRFLRHQKNIPKDSRELCPLHLTCQLRPRTSSFLRLSLFFCWRRKNFLHFVETRSKPSRMIPQQTRFIFRDTFFSYAHLTCVVFAWRGKVKVFFLNRC